MSTAELKFDIIDRIVNMQDHKVLAHVSAILQDSTDVPEENHWDTLSVEEQHQIIEAAANTHDADRWVSWESIKEKYSKWS